MQNLKAGFIFCALALSACGASFVRTQSVLATGFADAANRALPLWIAAYHDQAAHAIEAACPAASLATQPDCSARRLDALRRVSHDWSAIATAWDGVAAAQATWAERIDDCNRGAASGGQGCDVDLRVMASDFGVALHSWRCAVRSLGRDDLDQFPGALVCDEPTDGGTDGH